MSSAKAWLGEVVGRVLFREAEVTAVRDVAPGFRLAKAEGADLRNVAWTPGDKVQVFLAGEGMRTYTPMTWDRERGQTTFLLHVHGAATTPGAAWAKKLAVGERFRFFGPRGSIGFPALGRDVLFFGDETSFAAASALHAVNAHTSYVFEATDVDAAAKALTELGVTGASVLSVVARREGDEHVNELAGQLAAHLEANGRAQLTMTGRAQTIQSIKRALSARGLRAAGKTKAYWSVGKAGLD